MSAGKHVALLRGINVGGKNILPMRDLVAMFVKAGCKDVTTYIQSGNVLFSTDGKVTVELADGIARQIEKRFGYRIPVVLRTVAEMIAVAQGNPFLKAGAAEDLLHVSFLSEQPVASDVAGLDLERSTPDTFAVVGREIYLQLPNGAARTKLTNAYFDSKLKTVSTQRNWRTVLKLIELMS